MLTAIPTATYRTLYLLGCSVSRAFRSKPVARIRGTDPLSVLGIVRRYTDSYVTKHFNNLSAQVESTLVRLGFCQTADLGSSNCQCNGCDYSRSRFFGAWSNIKCKSYKATVARLLEPGRIEVAKTFEEAESTAATKSATTTVRISPTATGPDQSRITEDGRWYQSDKAAESVLTTIANRPVFAVILYNGGDEAAQSNAQSMPPFRFAPVGIDCYLFVESTSNHSMETRENAFQHIVSPGPSDLTRNFISGLDGERIGHHVIRPHCRNRWINLHWCLLPCVKETTGDFACFLPGTLAVAITNLDMWMDRRFDRISFRSSVVTRFSDHESGNCGRSCRFASFSFVCDILVVADVCGPGIRTDFSRFPNAKSRQ